MTLERVASTARPLGALVTHRFAMEDYGRAIEASLDRRGARSVKAILTP
ncbi:MAG: hypothetical protein R3A52_22575 [Polyangiales bacterium]